MAFSFKSMEWYMRITKQPKKNDSDLFVFLKLNWQDVTVQHLKENEGRRAITL